MPDVAVIAIIAVTFLLAGLVKGVVGFGLPTVALAILTATIGLKEAMVLMLAPAFVTNVWQGFAPGGLGAVLRRFWPLLATGAIGTVAGASVLARADAALLPGMLGVLLCVYATISIAAPRLPPPGDRECWLSPVVGATSGVLTGLTGTFVIPSVLYFQSLAMERDVMIQTMGVWFLVATASLGVALGAQGLMPADLSALSAAALVPALAGMWLGQRIRRNLSEARFRRVFFSALLLLGAWLTARAFVL
jgi:uncharacterized membrane protein YfcA